MAARQDPVPSVEIVVMWGEDPVTAEILHVGYVPEDRDFSVGDATLPDGAAATDYVIDHEQLGLPLLPIVTHGARGPLLVVPAGASLRTVSDQGVPRTAAQLLVEDALCASGNPTFPFALPIHKGTNAWLSYRGFTFVVRAIEHEQPIAASRAPDWKEQRFTFASVGAHLFLLLLFYYAPPASSALASDAITMRERYLDYVLKPNEFELDPLPDYEPGEGTPSDSDQAPKGESGKNGEPKATATSSKKTQQASLKSAAPQEELRELASQAGIIGILRSAVPVGEGAFKAASASGFDEYSSLRDILGLEDGPSFGNGLGTALNGRGGGGHADGTVVSGVLTTVGVGGPGTGGSRYGVGVGRLKGREARVPRAPTSIVRVAGGLSKESIRRVIHRNLNQVRSCYEQALQARPDLQGRVAVQFIIDATGAVKVATVASSDLKNNTVEACITGAVRRWTFGQPEGGGIVSVTYPFVLEQVGQ